MQPTAAPVGRTQLRSALRNSSISFSTSSGSLNPSRLKNLMPLYSAGLCDAEITTPPSAFELPGQQRHRGRRHDLGEQRVGTTRHDARDEGSLKHVAATTRVAAHDDATSASVAQEVPRRLPQPER